MLDAWREVLGQVLHERDNEWKTVQQTLASDQAETKRLSSEIAAVTE
jgi:hypothetical protein